MFTGNLLKWWVGAESNCALVKGPVLQTICHVPWLNLPKTENKKAPEALWPLTLETVEEGGGIEPLTDQG